MEGILTPLVTHAGILTSGLHAGFRQRFTGTGTLSYRSQSELTASEGGLSPVEFSAPEHLTSELLRTLSRNGCF